VVSRIKNVTITQKHFAIPASFSMDRYMEETFDQIHEDEIHNVVIRFTPYQAQWIKEHCWYSSQEIDEQKDGSVILKMSVGALDTVMHWVLRYGKKAEVLKPRELLLMIKEELQFTKRIYKAKVKEK
jgi:proteasome accessory factor B